MTWNPGEGQGGLEPGASQSGASGPGGWPPESQPGPAAPPPPPGWGATPPWGPGTPPPAVAWAPPPADYGWGGPGALRVAGAGERFVAWMIDRILLAIINIPIGVALGAILLGSFAWRGLTYGTQSEVGSGVAGATLLVAFLGALIGIAIDLAYFVFLWSSGERGTPGMRILGLQIAQAADGRTITRGAATRRWAAMGAWLGVVQLVPGLGGLAGLVELAWWIVLLATTLGDPERRGLHDRFADTMIVTEANRSNTGAIVGCLLIMALLIVLPIVALILLGGQVSSILSEVGQSI